MAKAKEPKFATEAALCAAFVSDLPKHAKDWTAYPETAGFDLLLSHKDGTQVGIEAKLSLNVEVVRQALPRWTYSDVGPDFRAVLVPDGEQQKGLRDICDHVGIAVISQRHPDSERWGRGHIDLPSLRTAFYRFSNWHPWMPSERCKLPDYVPDVVAGAPAPQTLSAWKISAIKAQIILERRPLTKADIRALNMSPSRWFDRYTGFLVATPEGYVASRFMPDFSKQHPTNYAQIKADADKWLPPIEAVAAPSLQLRAAI